MKIFGNAFIRRDYATITKLETFLSKELKKNGFDIRKDSSTSFIVSSDRADLMTISFKVYARSFGIWTLDAYGVQNAPVKSCFGTDWRGFMKRQMRDILYSLNSSWVRDGHHINSKWQRMMQEIAYPDVPDEWAGIVITPSFKEMMSK